MSSRDQLAATAGRSLPFTTNSFAGATAIPHVLTSHTQRSI
jgi:hypothetical protein